MRLTHLGTATLLVEVVAMLIVAEAPATASRGCRTTLAHDASDIGPRPIVGPSRADALEAIGLPPSGSCRASTRSQRSPSS